MLRMPSSLALPSRGEWLTGSMMASALASALATVLLLAQVSRAQTPSLPGLGKAEAVDAAEPAAEDPTSPAQIDARLEAVALELQQIEARLAAAPSAVPLQAHLTEVRQRLQSIDGLLRRQAGAHEPAAAPTPSEPLPDALEPSVFTLNRLLDARFEEAEQQNRRSEIVEASRAALATARQALEEAEKARREARAELDSTEEGPKRVQAERALELRQLASRAARERVNLRSLEVRDAKRRVEMANEGSPRLATLDARIAEMHDALSKGMGTLDAGLEELARQETDLRRKRAEVERRLSSATVRFDAAKQRFSRQSNPEESLLERVEGLAAEREAIGQQLALIDAQLERLEARRALWRSWDTLLRGEAPRAELETWKDSALAQMQGQQQTRLQREAEKADLERRMQAIDARLESFTGGSSMRSVLEQQRASFSELLDGLRREVEDLAQEQRLADRYLAELRSQTGEVDVVRMLGRGLDGARDVWRYEITAVEDSPITVGSLALALLLFSIGLWVSRRAADLVGRLAGDRFKLDTGAAHAIHTLSFYVLLISFTLLALRAVHFPLTAFTVLGGALAIGIGFGSQNVMNNFISGLILMLERPVRAGDLVEVDGNHGSIENIGARSTQIRSVDGRHLVVPNSFFLETNVVNWTLSDDLIRTSVMVGVVYGSPTRLVEKLIQQVVDEDPAVIRPPEPVLLFNEFGDNSLNFVVHFWVRARSPMGTRRVQSRMRFRIDDLFREHGLVIAFPQRDVHLDSVSPIEVRVVTDAKSEIELPGDDGPGSA